jgi:parallel beta-helix repeat protein
MRQKMFKYRLWEASSVLVILALILALGTALLTPSPASGAATWYVDGTLGTDNSTQGTGPGINAFKTIQYSITDSRVIDSDTMLVAAGVYNEDIEINKALTIQSSAGATNTVIRGSGGGSSYYMIRIFHSNVTFDGFTVTNPNYQDGADASGILIANFLGGSVNNIRILNNIIKEVRNSTAGTPSSYGATGINIGSGAPSNITISGNTIQNIHNPDGASIDHTCGINIWDNGSGIEISNNLISDIKYNGIFLQYANNVRIKSNNITQCQAGIKIDPYAGAVVTGVTIDHNIILGNTNYGVDNHGPNIVDAQNNWWGCNDGPGAVGPGSGDMVSSNVTYAPWLLLILCANPPSIQADGVSTSTITANMNKNSIWKDTSAQGHIQDGTQIIFATDKGSLGSPTTKTTTNGIATAVFMSDAIPSQATVSAKAPLWNTCATSYTPVNMYQLGGNARLSSCDWAEYSNNPVLGQWIGNPNRAYYPKIIYDPNQFSKHGESAYYKMWFNTYIGTAYSIRYAYSNDGINWTAPNPVNGLASSSGHPLVKYDADGFSSGIYYKIWYWTGIMDYTIGNLRYAESSDGINWTNDQPLTQDVSYPLVTGNSGPDWNAGSYGPCDLIYNPSGSSSLDDGNLWNNKYVMYYMGTTGGNQFIGLAYSNNGTHWKRYGCNPVLMPCTLANDPTVCWDYYAVGYCTVLNISGTWHMWYCGGEGTNHGIGYATSPDGISWTKQLGNPIFHIGDGIPWRNDRTYTPCVVYDAASFSGHGDAYPYKMWFTGVSTDGKYSIGYAYMSPILTDAGPDRIITSGSSVVIGGSPTASGGLPPYTYNWVPSTGLNNPTTANPTASPTTTTVYSVTVTDSKGCTGSDNMTLTVQTPLPVGGGGGGGVTAAEVACPLGLATDIQGTITITSMTGKGALCETCIAKDASGKYVLELDKDTQITLTDNAVPLLLTLRVSSKPPPTPENTVVMGQVYEISAYPTSYATIPLPVTISPPAIVTLPYDPDELPENATEVYVADFDTTKGWLALAPVPGVVAELGKVQGLASHFSPIAVLAKLAEPTSAKFEVGNLVVSPHQAQPNQEVTITIEVNNTGGKSGDYSLQFKVDNVLKSSKQVTIAAGASQTVNFTTDGYAAGKHQVEVAGLSGEFEIIKISQPASTSMWFIVGALVLLLLIGVVLIALRR